MHFPPFQQFAVLELRLVQGAVENSYMMGKIGSKHAVLAC
jgi:hypothetical protein